MLGLQRLFLGISVWVSAWTLPSPIIYACSSCGSGAADPVILNPAESQKLYLGLGQSRGFQEFNSEGDLGKSYGPERKSVITVGFAQRLHPKFFASLVLELLQNTADGESVNGRGDVSLNSRTTLLQANMAEPWLPQVQLMLSHRFAQGKSVRDQTRERFLDVFGSGYDESYLGVDLWYGMHTIVGGGSFLIGLPGKDDSEAGWYQPGRLQRAILTLGLMPNLWYKVIGGIIDERRGEARLAGVQQDSSEKISHDVFFTLETLATEGSNFRLTLTRKAAFGDNRNATRQSSLTLAWMETL